MSKGCCGGLVALMCLVLLGCAERPAVSQAEAVDLLRTGRPLLSCREDCVAAWRRAQPQAAQLDGAARWPELTVLVLGVGYQDDLSLYYLGRAAEGIGYPGAAASYYRQSTHISGTSLSCRQQSKACGGLAMPQVSLLRLAAIDRELNRSRPRRTAPAAPGPASPVAAPSEPELPPSPASFAAPPPELPPPPPRRTGPAASEYIEPPAAR
jgi:hypothetical protein